MFMLNLKKMQTFDSLLKSEAIVNQSFFILGSSLIIAVKDFNFPIEINLIRGSYRRRNCMSVVQW